MISQLFTLKQLEAMIWVADLGSFHKAAAHLNTTQPNISARINGLENALNITLFHRGDGRVQVTDQGANVLLAARQVLKSGEMVIDAAQNPELITHRLRLGVTELVACTWLPQFLQHVKSAFPAVQVELTVDLSYALDTSLTQHALDLTLQTAPFAGQGYAEIPLGSYDYAWMAAPALAQAGVLTLPQLASMTILTHAKHTQAYGDLVKQAKAQGVKPAQFVSSNSLSACLQMAVAGLGVALLPAAMAQGDITAGRLQVLRADWLAAPLQFFARYHADHSPNYIAQVADIAARVSAQHSIQ